MDESPERPNIYRRAGNLIAYPFFSLEERERRWDLVRQALDAEGLDCLVVPPGPLSTGWGATTRYLTHVGGGDASEIAAVFPVYGQPAAVARHAERWLLAQPWCTDLREAGDSFIAGVRSRIREMPRTRRRIGIFGLKADPTTGASPSNAFVGGLLSAFPEYEIVDFTTPLQRIRAAKSTEELAFLDQSAGLLTSAWTAAARALGEGAAAARAAAIEDLCRLGSDAPDVPAWPGSEAQRSQAADGVLAELEAAWGGYRCRSAGVLTHGSSRLASLTQSAVEAWNQVFCTIRPGRMAERLAPPRASSSGVGAPDLTIQIAGCGLGGDPPSVTADSSLRIEEGWCLYLRVTATQAGATAHWGDSFVVTTRGARRLGTMPQELWSGAVPFA